MTPREIIDDVRDGVKRGEDLLKLLDDAIDRMDMAVVEARHEGWNEAARLAVEPTLEAPAVIAAVQAMRELTRLDGDFGRWAAGAEQMEVSAETTGYKGGDAGHGGETSVTFTIASGSHGVTVKRIGDGPTGGRIFSIDDESFELTLTANGDWEQAGLITALRDAWLSLAMELEKARPG